MEGDHGRIIGGDHLPGRGALQQLGHPQGLQHCHPRGESHPQAIGCERPAGAIEGRHGRRIVARDQGEGVGGGEQLVQPQAIAQPVPVGLQQLQQGGGIAQAPALSQPEAIEGGPLIGLQLSAALQGSRGGALKQGGADHGLICRQLGRFGNVPQIHPGLGSSVGAGCGALGLQLPPFGLQQPGDGGLVCEPLAVAVGPQLGPGLQPGTIGRGLLQLPQQRVCANSAGRVSPEPTRRAAPGQRSGANR